MSKLRHWLAMLLTRLAWSIDGKHSCVRVTWIKGNVYFDDMPPAMLMTPEDAISFADGITRAALNANPKSSPLGKMFSKAFENEN